MKHCPRCGNDLKVHGIEATCASCGVEFTVSEVMEGVSDLEELKTEVARLGALVAAHEAEKAENELVRLQAVVPATVVHTPSEQPHAARWGRRLMLAIGVFLVAIAILPDWDIVLEHYFWPDHQRLALAVGVVFSVLAVLTKPRDDSF